MDVRVFPRAVRQKPPLGWQVDPNHPLAKGLAGCWVCNEGGGGVAHDMTATPAPGTLTNAPRWEVAGGSGGGLALRFTAASSQYVLVGNPTKLQITGALTIATHYRIPAGVPSGSQMLVTKDDNVSQRSWSMDVASGATGGVRLYISGGNGDLVTNTGCENRAPVAGEDRAVVGVYDPSGPQVRVYANGSLVGSSTSAAASIPASTATVQFGGRVSAESYLDGWLRYVYIWHRVLSAAEIAALARAPYAMFCAPARTMVTRRGFAMAGMGATTVDFGAFPGKMDAQVDITGETAILSGSLVEAWISPVATADHTADEHWVELIQMRAGNVVAGTGFTIYARGDSEFLQPRQEINCDAAGNPLPPGHRLYGQYAVNWAWV